MTIVLMLAMTGAAWLTAARAAEPQVPVLWDAKERLPKPDLSALPRLRFLTTTDFPPFNFLDGAGRLSGFHVDLARAICAELGIAEKCQIQALPWAELEGALQKGEGEAIIAGIAATPESRSKYAFSRSYLQFPARFIMPKAKALTEPIFDRLRGKRVGVVAGSAHERMLRDYFGTVQVVPFAQLEELYDGLKDGKVDAGFGDGMRFAFWLGSSNAAACCRFAGGPYLSPEYLGSGMAIATRANDPALAAAFDYALQEISVKGIFAEFYLRYFPVSFF
ncbi:MAG: transporter substrate-binding domain-containing protein [Mesorhizobium sp.]|nr:MAG: transporter substrate-binding domain-containing protein [Mesorhizobium sp.]RWN53571.1 MAG: transporter substrate-binding domain-containing protein [Mesorhizobium sp.]RWN71115.1 MAG: transporter substrate-binding domain-containing protein [Mesorhizobium sp.]RWN71603.1 MAG: transporter substrate-binding domain-containing protein [Mesorhizobium sp.]RWN82994.1 MAG: transporter substrate-binding domain-containing protein [Mesorhizobium sp.]